FRFRHRCPPCSPLFPYTTLFRSVSWRVLAWAGVAMIVMVSWMTAPLGLRRLQFFRVRQVEIIGIRFLDADQVLAALRLSPTASVDRKSTRLNSSHEWISYAVFCL